MGAVAATGLGLSITRVARALGVTPMPLPRALPRGRGLVEARGLQVEQIARQAMQKGD